MKTPNNDCTYIGDRNTNIREYADVDEKENKVGIKILVHTNTESVCKQTESDTNAQTHVCTREYTHVCPKANMKTHRK